MEREESYRLCPACDDGNCLAVKFCCCCDSYLCAGCWNEHSGAGKLRHDRLGWAVFAFGMLFYAALGTVVLVFAVSE